MSAASKDDKIYAFLCERGLKGASLAEIEAACGPNGVRSERRAGAAHGLAVCHMRHAPISSDHP